MTGGRSSGLQTLLVGLDGACLPILDRLADAGVVPTVQRLITDGYVDDLASQLPPWTPSAWPSLYTGVNPGKHGVYGFLTFDGYDWAVVDRTDVREYAMWELLDDHGYRSVVVNVPVTHPPRPIEGAIVPGYVAPEDPTCVPGDVLSTVTGEMDYRIYPPSTREVSPREQLSAYESIVRSRGRVFRRLTDRYDPHFSFLQFQLTDTVFHDRPDDWSAVERVYGAVDEQLDAVLEATNPRNVVIVSDHGMGEYEGYEFRVNEYLRAEGYVETRHGGEGMPSWDSIARNRLKAGEEAGARDRSVLEQATASLAKVGLTSQRAERVLETVGLADHVAEVVPTDAIRAGTEQVDFAASTAYMRSRIELGVRLNVEGREPDGEVPPERYDEVRETLLSKLRGVRSPEGYPIFETVHRREDVFEGPYVDEAPDLVIVPRDLDQFLSGSLRGPQFDSPSEPWNHKYLGVIVATGQDIDASAMGSADRPQLFDIAPTVLSTFGVAPSERMDGVVLPLVESCERRAYPEFDAREGRTRDDEAVEEHLADLGYLEDI
jgi:predicted AlkP superfamily phosphohydrolase/phosphomutase